VFASGDDSVFEHGGVQLLIVIASKFALYLFPIVNHNMNTNKRLVSIHEMETQTCLVEKCDSVLCRVVVKCDTLIEE